MTGDDERVRLEEQPTGSGTSEPSYFVVKLLSTKTVTDKMIQNLIQKTKAVTPAKMKVCPQNDGIGTLIFLLYQQETEISVRLSYRFLQTW